MGRDEHQPLSEEEKDWEFPSGKELGALLRDKRKELGLTLAQVSERIKVRIYYLEALENEDWDHLPSPTFIKGFIRSYARILGLSEEGLIGLYQETAPRPQPMPQPLQGVSKRKRGPLYIFLIFAVLAGGFAVYNWKGHSPLIEGTNKQASIPPASERSTDTQTGQDIQLNRLESEKAPQDDVKQPPTPSAPDRKLPQEGLVSGSGGKGFTEKGQEAPLQGAEQDASIKVGSPPEPEKPLPDTVPAPEGDKPPLTLKAYVRERTWIRVMIDNERPKEYIFGPESTPEWRAHNGFELLIGNAGGIDLEFNGERMEDLGKQGQVIRLRLPSGYERKVSKD